MKTKIFSIFLLAIVSSFNLNAQLKVFSDGKVRIGGGTLSPSASLQVQESGKTTEARIYAASGNISRLWTMNSQYSFGFGVDAAGTGHIWKNVSSPSSILYITDQGKFGFSNTNPLGTIHIGTDSESYGLTFYCISTGLTSFRLYRKNNVAYITRGGFDDRGFRIYEYGNVKLYTVDTATWANLFTVKAKQNFSKCLVVEDAYSDTSRFEVQGNGFAYSRGVFLTSDIKLKEDISEIDSPLDKVTKLHGVSYRYKKSEQGIKQNEIIYQEKDSLTEIQRDTDSTKYISEEVRQKIMEEQNRKSLGLIAQEVEEFVPEAVRTASNGYKSISYSDLVGLLIEAMKEQQKIIDSLAGDISDLKSGSSGTLKSALLTTYENLTEQTDIPVLYQNVPNPFDKDTEIRFYIPGKMVDAKLFLYNMQGNQIRSTIIYQRGKGYEIIHGSELQPGMYLYTLIVDGREVDTKRMILTD